MKKLMIVMGLLMIAGMAATSGWAASFDTIELYIAPASEYGVIVDTTSVDFGTVDMNTSTRTVNPIPVYSTGTTSPLEYTLQATINNGWSLATTDNPAENTAVLFAKFNSVDPDGTAQEYGANDIADASAAQVGDGSPGNFEGDQEMDDMPLDYGTTIWFKIKTPTSTTSTSQKTITVTISAEAAN